jgi:hypothetical protein
MTPSLHAPNAYGPAREEIVGISRGQDVFSVWPPKQPLYGVSLLCKRPKLLHNGAVVRVPDSNSTGHRESVARLADRSDSYHRFVRRPGKVQNIAAIPVEHGHIAFLVRIPKRDLSVVCEIDRSPSARCPARRLACPASGEVVARSPCLRSAAQAGRFALTSICRLA